MALRRPAALLAALVFALCVACAPPRSRWLDYPRLGLHDPVVIDGQAQIDQGDVVDVIGLPGIWLAGHRTTHGAVFANLVGARVGDGVCVYGRCYTVTKVFTVSVTYGARYLGPLVLQTSLPAGRDLLVICH